MAGTETKRIIELTEASTVQSGDFIAVDSNARGTKKVSTDTLATSTALTAETNARTGADAAEAQAREAADNTLGGQVADLKSDLNLISGNTENLFVHSGGIFNGVTVKVLSDGGLRITGTCSASVNATQSITPFYGQYSLACDSDTSIDSGSLYIYLRNASGTQIQSMNMSGTRQEKASTALESNPISKIDLTFIAGKTYDCTLYIQLLKGLAYKPFISPYTAVDRIARSYIDEFEYILNTEIFSETGYYKSDGTRQPDSSFVCKITDFIRTYEGCKYNYKGWGSSSAYSVFFYDTSKTLLSSLQYDSRNEYTEVTIPENCEYVRFSSYHGSAFTPVLEVQVVDMANRIQSVPISNNSDGSSDVLNGKKWYALGDSFTHGDFSGVTAPYIESGKYVGQLAVYPYLIGNRKNMSVTNMGVNGGTIAESGDSSVYALSRSGNYDSIPSDADYVTIMIGINDSGKNIPIGAISDTENTTFYGAWNTVLGWLRANRPNAHIGIAISLSLHEEYRNAEIAVAKKYGYPYINLPEDETLPALLWASRPNIDASVQTMVNENQRCSASNFHPNAEAHKLLSTIIGNWLYAL